MERLTQPSPLKQGRGLLVGAFLGRDKVLAAAGLVGCAVPLLVAVGSEKFLGLVPCAFCLIERKPYYAGLVVALAGLVVPRRAGRAWLWALVALLTLAAILSFVHVGVEAHFWPDPLPECTVPDFSGMTMAQRIAAMPARPTKPCEFPDYLIPGVPLSMTQMAFLYALAVCGGLAMWLLRSRGRMPR